MKIGTCWRKSDIQDWDIYTFIVDITILGVELFAVDYNRIDKAVHFGFLGFWVELGR